MHKLWSSVRQRFIRFLHASPDRVHPELTRMTASTPPLCAFFPDTAVFFSLSYSGWTLARCRSIGTFLLFILFALQATQRTARAATGVLSEYASEGLNFSIVFPEDWDVVQNVSGFEVFAEPKEKAVPTASNPVVADPNIAVAVSKNPMPIDEESLEKYAIQMVLGLQKSLGESAQPEVFLKRMIEIKNQRPALLYYIRYKKGKFEVYNAIVVASTDTHLFRVTLTDYAVSFDANLEKLFPYVSTLDVGAGQAVRPDILSVATPWIGGAIAFLIFMLVLQVVRNRLFQSSISANLAHSSRDEGSSARAHSRAVEFKGHEVDEDYDPEFRQSSESSRFDGDDQFTEVPLSQAIGSGAAGSHIGYASRHGRGSVADPETEVSGFSSKMSRAARNANFTANVTSESRIADHTESFVGSFAGPDVDTFSRSPNEVSETKKIVPPPPPGTPKSRPPAEAKVPPSRPPSLPPKPSGQKSSASPASSGIGMGFSQVRDDDEV